MMKLLIIVFAVCATRALAGALPPDLSKALRDFDRAHYQSDIPMLTQLTDDEYTVLNSNISLENKTQFLADFRLPGFKIDPYTRRDEVNRVWKDSAVTAGVVNLSWAQDGHHHSRLLRYIDVWRNEHGRWKATFTQVTRAQR